VACSGPSTRPSSAAFAPTSPSTSGSSHMRTSDRGSSRPVSWRGCSHPHQSKFPFVDLNVGRTYARRGALGGRPRSRAPSIGRSGPSIGLGSGRRTDVSVALDRNKVQALAQKHLAKGNYDKAIVEYRRLVEENPHDFRTWLKIGDLYTRQGDRRGATETYGK